MRDAGKLHNLSNAESTPFEPRTAVTGTGAATSTALDSRDLLRRKSPAKAGLSDGGDPKYAKLEPTFRFH